MTATDVHSAIQDPDRIAALRRTGLLDTAPEAPFDRLTELAAKTLRVPVALISLSGEECDFRGVVSSSGPLVVEDARNHSLSDDPCVGTYAGAPLEVSGLKIASFSVIDFEPRQWSASGLRLMEQLARSTACEIELPGGDSGG